MKITIAVLAIVAFVGSASAGFGAYSPKCAANEVLVASPPCCEPTCDCDCMQSSCQQLLVYQPSCVCMKGYVRYNGQCVPQSCCPDDSYETTMAPYTTAPPPVYQPPTCGCGQYPCQCPQQNCGCGQYPCQCAQPYNPPVYQPAYPCETTTPPYETTMAPYTYPPPVYQPPTCGCGQYPCQCAQQTCGCGQTPCQCAQPTCGCGQYPCQCAQPTCGCGCNPCVCPQPACETTTPPYETTTPYVEVTTCPPPTCQPCEQLVFTMPCCEPSCDNDCSSVKCNPLLLVKEPTCACRPGLVRYQGHCVEPTCCPRSASRYRLYVPKAVSCACNLC